MLNLHLMSCQQLIKSQLILCIRMSNLLLSVVFGIIQPLRLLLDKFHYSAVYANVAGETDLNILLLLVYSRFPMVEVLMMQLLV